LGEYTNTDSRSIAELGYFRYPNLATSVQKYQ